MADRHWGGSAGAGAVYGLGFVGALIYYIVHAETVLGFLFGLIQAILWPAFLVYRVLEFLAI